MTEIILKWCKTSFSQLIVNGFELFNSVPNNRFLDWSKFKELADDKINATQKLKFVFGWVENIAGKGENAGCQHFLLFLQCLQKASFPGLLKVEIMW